ncbi:vWA domain-containing protein [Candidatus Parabeggiatoa sp. HSG14]|uniref:vWA domain-containing protein n=1 Tax=Candidatus Parabeggiatoa sp. HSG14 TaxID=3055593 RepID=UPI0025A8308D|nr:vWA domain-containing protein [Thiotrichales bacterium HSG14]
MSINKLFTQTLCVSLLILSSYSHAQSVSLSLNENSFAVGDFLKLSVAANVDEITATEADVFLAVQFPDGSLYYWSDLGIQFIHDRDEIVSLITAWRIQTLPEMTILDFEIPPGLPTGTYKWYLTLTKPEKGVAQPANWLVEVSATFVLTGERFKEERTTSEDDGGDESFFEEGEGSLGGEMEESMAIESEAMAPGVGFSKDKAAGAKADMAVTTGSSMDSVASPAMEAPSMAKPSPPPSSPSDGMTADFADEEVAADFDSDIMIEPFPMPEPMPLLPPPPEIFPVSGTLTAGDIDDNLNFAAFQRYQNRQQGDRYLPFVDMSDRVTLHIVDSEGQGVSNARVGVLNSPIDSAPVIETYAGTDGRFYLFPEFDGITNSQVDLHLMPPEDDLGSATSVFNATLDLTQLDEERNLTITLPNAEATLPYSLDVMFVIDATGSMSDELRYLIVELRDIIGAVQARHQQIMMRFGLVLYRDKGDEYVVRDFAFTDSLNEMQIQLNKQEARGGGNYPEAMEEALETAVNAEWRGGNIARLIFLVADAPPHDKNFKVMLEQVRIARHKGLRIYSLAASGVGDKAEFMMRNASVLTQGRYLFLTDDSGVGFSHKEPSVSCYVVTRLNELVSRVIAGELAGQRIEPDDEDILRSVGNYDSGVCVDGDVIPPNPPNPSTPKAQVENIRVQILESFPVQVQVVAEGYLRNSCEQLDKATSSRNDDLFTVKITTRSTGDMCAEVITPFKKTVRLDVKGLKAGTYTVDVNGITDTFELSVDNTVK